jgi:hypothetical protein
MRLIYTSGFSKNEKLEWKPVVFNNIVQSFRLIFDAMNELDIKFENEDNEVGVLTKSGTGRDTEIYTFQEAPCLEIVLGAS